MQNSLMLCCALALFSITLSAQEVGTASYYHPGLDGQKTSSGQRYRHDKKTAASRNYPFGTILRVTRIDNNKSTEVRVNDCGPRRQDRIIDLSGAAAEELDLIRDGLAQVRIEVVKMGKGRQPCGASYSVAPTPSSYENTGSERVAAKAPATPKGPAIDGQGTFRADALRPIDSGFGVQVGAYRDYDNAANQAKAMQDKGYSKVLVRLQGNMHQVILGPFSTREEANTYRNNLWKNYRVKGFVTPLAGE
ncbi:MAG: septal ring lytic transglycosylase RlpA family protein [Bacteroidetes bacterium]|nr:MAG: septal ring lytic transglycosylase RlpA family protein [Bacteroidota bacterium]